MIGIQKVFHSYVYYKESPRASKIYFYDTPTQFMRKQIKRVMGFPLNNQVSYCVWKCPVKKKNTHLTVISYFFFFFMIR